MMDKTEWKRIIGNYFRLDLPENKYIMNVYNIYLPGFKYWYGEYRLKIEPAGSEKQICKYKGDSGLDKAKKFCENWLKERENNDDKNKS